MHRGPSALKLAELVSTGAPKHPDVSMEETMGWSVMSDAEAAGYKASEPTRNRTDLAISTLWLG